MIASNERCHIVNTSSMAGLIVGPAFSPYTATKHAVIGLTRSLYEDLKNEYPKIGVSVLCPGLVKTNIMKRDKSGLNLNRNNITTKEKMNTKRRLMNFRVPIDVISGFQNVCNLNYTNMTRRVIWLLKEDIKNQSYEFKEYQLNTKHIKEIADKKLSQRQDYSTWEQSYLD